MTASATGRFVVRMEVFAAHDTADLTDDDLGGDYLEEIGDLLGIDTEPDLSPAYAKMRYDLCPECHKKFLADPLSREAPKFDFSEN